MIDRRTHRCLLLQLVRLDDDGDDGGDDDDGDGDGELARRSVHFIAIIVNGRIACDDAGITITSKFTPPRSQLKVGNTL